MHEQLHPGDVWDARIREELLSADIALVLVSQALLDSDYVKNVEIRALLERARQNGLVIFPVILSPCEWDRYGWLADLQHLPGQNKTLVQHYNRPGPRDEMYQKIREELRRRLRTKHPAERAIEAMSGAVNVINSLESQYRAVTTGKPEEHFTHSLHFEGAGSEVRIYRNQVLEKTITAATIRHFHVADLETITTMQKAIRRHYEKWVDLYGRRDESAAAGQLSQLARELRPDLLAAIVRLKEFGLDLEDHYDRFYNFLNSQAGT